MGKKIECYIDCVSPTSYNAFLYLQKNASTLTDLGVEIEFIPVFLGGINVGSGNKPPWTLPAKAAYLKYDGQRAQEFFENPITVPSWFPILSLLPQRALTYIKQTTPKSQYEDAFNACFEVMWKGQVDISQPENLTIALGKVFPEPKVKEILVGASSPRIKTELTAVTEKVVKEQGAFGCPWFWVRNAEGKEEPFFGSDRFHFMWRFLGLPFEDLKLKSRM